jgi:hypothetical protein
MLLCRLLMALKRNLVFYAIMGVLAVIGETWSSRVQLWD